MLNEKWDDFGIFAGSESFLLKTMQQGGLDVFQQQPISIPEYI